MVGECSISLADGAADITAVQALFSAYQEWLGGDLCFQGFQAELGGLPGAYAGPNGCLLLARQGGKAVGVVGIRPTADFGHHGGDDESSHCEMKRLYVVPEARGHGLGIRLTLVSMDHARNAGYKTVYLETLVELTAARYLYRSLGFSEMVAKTVPAITIGSGNFAERSIVMAMDLGQV